MVTLKFKKSCGWYDTNDKSEAYICRGVMHELFDIPVDIVEIDVILSHKPTEQSYLCNYRNNAYVAITDTKGGVVDYTTTYGTDDSLNLLIAEGKIKNKFHLSVQY